MCVASFGDDTWLPARWQQCPTCEGRGRYVNPAIDSHGLSADDFADPDFEDAYLSGAYDVTCNQCNGRRNILVPDESRNDKATIDEFWKDVDQTRDAYADDWHTRRAEQGWYDG